jgi:hypothetical protein
MRDDELGYLTRRLNEEAERAARAERLSVRGAHAGLAALYRQRIAKLPARIRDMPLSPKLTDRTIRFSLEPTRSRCDALTQAK